MDKRRRHYKSILKENPRNYDIWLDLVLLEQSIKSNEEATSRTFESIFEHPPELGEKRYWKKFIYLCLARASFLEVDCRNPARAHETVSALNTLLLEKGVSSKKTWLFGFRQLVRQKEVSEARRWLGRALGLAPHAKIFKAYVEFELQLGNFDRCEAIFKKWLQTFPENAESWENYLEYNQTLDKRERVEAVFKLAVSGTFGVARPEKIYKKYIDILAEWGELDQVRETYRQLLAKTGHVKVFLALAYFEASQGEVEKMRQVFEGADRAMKGKSHLKEERALLLRNWLDLEKEHSAEESAFIEYVRKKMPKKVRKERQVEIEGESGKEVLLEEYFDFLFPDELESAKGLKLLQKAKIWQHNKMAMKE